MLEPEIAAFVAAVDAAYPAGAAALSPGEQRRLYDRFAAAWTPAQLPAGVVQHDAVWHAPDGRAIALRRYARAHAAPRGTVLFFHGGGFVVGSLDSHALITAQLAADTGLAVIAVTIGSRRSIPRRPHSMIASPSRAPRATRRTGLSTPARDR